MYASLIQHEPEESHSTNACLRTATIQQADNIEAILKNTNNEIFKNCFLSTKRRNWEEFISEECCFSNNMGAQSGRLISKNTHNEGMIDNIRSFFSLTIQTISEKMQRDVIR